MLFEKNRLQAVNNKMQMMTLYFHIIGFFGGNDPECRQPVDAAAAAFGIVGKPNYGRLRPGKRLDMLFGSFGNLDNHGGFQAPSLCKKDNSVY